MDQNVPAWGTLGRVSQTAGERNGNAGRLVVSPPTRNLLERNADSKWRHNARWKRTTSRSEGIAWPEYPAVRANDVRKRKPLRRVKIFQSVAREVKSNKNPATFARELGEFDLKFIIMRART